MAPPVPLPVRDTRKERLLAWKLEKEAAGRRRARSSSLGGSSGGDSSGSWPASRVDDDKQRILQRRRANMAAPSLAGMRRKHQDGDERVRRWQAEMESDAEEAALSATAQAAAEAALEPGHYSGNQHQGREDECELKARVSSGATSPSPHSSPIARDSEGDNQRSEPGMYSDSPDGDEDNTYVNQEDDTFKEALTHPEDVEADDLAGSYFALDAADALPLDGQSPLLDDDQQQEYEDEQPVLFRRTIETMDVDVRVHRSVETVVVPANPEEPTRNLVHAASDDETSFSITDTQATTSRFPVEGTAHPSIPSVHVEHERVATSTSTPRRKSGTRGCCRYVMVLLVSVLAVGVAVSGAIVWRDPTSPLSRSVKQAAALTVTTLGTKAVDSAHWVEDRLQQSSLAPFVEKFALALDSVVENSSHWSKTITVQLKSAAAGGWSGLKSCVEVATSEPCSMYHTLATKAANVSSAMKDYIVDRWTEYVHGGKLLAGDSTAEFVDPLAGERVRMAAIKQQLDHQEAWVLKELERMKARRAVYSSAADSLLSESKSMISDSIHEAKDAAVRRIKTFGEQIAGALKGSAFQESVNDHAAVKKPAEGSDGPRHQPNKVDEAVEGHQMNAEEVAVAEAAANLLSDEAEIARIAQSTEEVVVEAEAGAAVEKLETMTHLQADSDAQSLRATAEQVEESTKVLADVTTQRQEALKAVESLAALESGLESQLSAVEMVHQVASVEAEKYRAEAADKLGNLELVQEIERAVSAPGDAALVREKLRRIAEEEELELEVTTVKVAAELLKTGAEIEEETLALREQLEAARAAAESETVESVCTDAHCLSDIEAIERVCEDAQCLAESESAERVCEGVRCAAAAVEHILQDVGAHIDAEKRDGADLGEVSKLAAHLIEKTGDQIVIHEVVDITSPLLPSCDVNITAGSRIFSASLAHMVPIAVLSSVFLGLAMVSGYYLRRAWKLRKQRIARHLRWRRRAQRKQWQWQTEDEAEDEAEEVVLLSGPSADSSTVEADSEDNGTASATSSNADGSEDADADAFVDEEATDDDGGADAGRSIDQGCLVSNVEFSDVTLSSVSGSTQPNSFMRVTRHAAQRVLSYSPVAPDSVPTSSRGMDSDESK